MHLPVKKIEQVQANFAYLYLKWLHLNESL